MHRRDDEVGGISFDIVLRGTGCQLTLKIPFLEGEIFSEDAGSAYIFRASLGYQPIPDPSNRFLEVSIVALNVPARDVRKRLLIIPLLLFEDQE